MKTTYTYTILRYTHDLSTGEFVNVGVALYAPEARWAGADCRTTYERFSGMFPDFDGNAFRRVTRFVSSRFRELNERLQNELALAERPKSVMELAHRVLPHDRAAFGWSEPAGGITDDPAKALQKIYARMVSRHDEKTEQGGRSDREVRDLLGQEFRRRGVARYLQEKTISSPHEEVHFPYAYKNGLWSCLEGVSLDVARPETIKDKARRWLGSSVALRKSPEDFRIILLLAEPHQPDAGQRKAVHRALDLLAEIPGKHRIVREGEIQQFANEFAQEVEIHEQETRS